MRSILICVSIALLTGGCALSTATIDVPYQPVNVQVAQVPGADGTTVAVEAVDARTQYRDRVSSKKNGYGMEMAAIIASNDIPSTVADALKTELTERGFKLGPGGPDVRVEVVKFYNDFKVGFFSGDAVADVALNVKITRPGGVIAFTKYYDGSGTEPNIQIAGGDNARAALIKALGNAIASVVNDPDFINALLTATPSGKTARAPSS